MESDKGIVIQLSQIHRLRQINYRGVLTYLMLGVTGKNNKRIDVNNDTKESSKAK
jgi:hypothetical protein